MQYLRTGDEVRITTDASPWGLGAVLEENGQIVEHFADRIREDTGTLLRIPELVRRIEERFPPKGGAPEAPPLPKVELMWERRRRKARGRGMLGYAFAAVAGGLAAWAATMQGWIG